MSMRLVLMFAVAATLLDPSVFLEVVSAQESAASGEAELQVLPVQGNVYMIAGAGANITVSTGFDGTLLVDAGRADMAEKVLATVEQLAAVVQMPFFPLAPCVGVRCPGGAGTGAYLQGGWTTQALNGVVHSPGSLKPIRYIINTSLDSDHTGGNAIIRAAGVTYTGGNVARGIGGQGAGAEIWAHDAVLTRMVQTKVPFEQHPQMTYHNTPKYKWNGFFNGEGLELLHVPAAQSDGDTIVYFRYSDVVSAGDVFAIDRYPQIHVEQGGSIHGTIEGLNKILDIAIPQNKAQGGTYIIPGHGRICDIGDVANYRNMVVRIHDRIQDLIKSGRTLEQVKASRPTLDFDGMYGSPDAFIEATYRSLSARR